MFQPLYVHLPLDVVQQRMDTLEELRLNVEVYLDIPTLESLQPGGLRSILSPLIGQGCLLHCHGPYDGSLMHSDPILRERFLEESIRCLERCAECDIPSAVFHSGWEEQDLDKDWEDWLIHAKKAWQRLGRASERTRVQLLLENTHEKRTEPLRGLIESLAPQAAFCMDIAHCHLNTGGLDPWIADLEHVLEHVHLSDCHGEKDDHLGLGQGQLPLDDMMKSIQQLPMWKKHRISAALEVNSEEGILRSLTYLLNRTLIDPFI